MKTCWIIGQYEEPIAAVETEADAEELFMDLVMEEQYEFCMAQINHWGRSMQECKNREWVWLTDWEYYFAPISNLLGN